MQKRLRQFLKISLGLILLVAALVLWANLEIVNSTKDLLKDNTADLPTVKTGLLLGTSPNEYLFSRIEAATTLFKSGKIKYILVSGDNRVNDYNEPEYMRRALVKNGVPDSVIYSDYAGLRTFDSVIRAREVFGQTDIIFISQEFHNQRAVYLARHYGMNAYGYNAKDVDAYKGDPTRTREVFARVKVFLDILTGKEPKFLGDKIKIGKQ